MADVSLLDEYGNPRVIDESDVQEALAHGWRAETPQEYQARVEAAQYGTTEQKIAGGLEAALRGATFGVSDLAMNKAVGYLGGEEAAQRDAAASAARQRQLGAVGTGLEVAGAVLPALATGGESLLARGAGYLPAGAAARLGGAAERVAARGIEGLGVSEGSVLGRAAIKGTGLAAGGAVEGGLMGAGQGLSEAVLAGESRDYDKVGERVLTGLKGGALGGAAIGGVFGAGIGTVGGLARKARIGTRGGEILQDLTDQATLKAVDPSKRAARELVNTKRAGSVAKELRDSGIVTKGGADLERAVAVQQEAGSAVGAVIKKLDEAGVMVDAAPILRKIDELAEKRLSSLSRTQENAGKALRDEFSKFRDAAEAGGGVMEPGMLHEFRAQLDDTIKYHKLQQTTLDKDIQTVRREIEGAIETTTGAFDPGDLAAYKAAKARYGAARWATEQLTDNLARGQSNRMFGMLDTIMGAGGLAGGLATGHIGTAALLTLAAGAGSKLIRSRAPAFIASTLSRMAESEKAMDRAVKSFMSAPAKVERKLVAATAEPAPRPFLPKPSDTMAAAYQQRTEQLRSMDPSRDPSIGQAAVEAPNTTTAAVSALNRARQYLLAEAPTEPLDGDPLQPHLKPTEPNRVELEKWARKWEAINDPLGTVTKGLEEGTLTRDQVEAIKEVYPVTFQEIRAKVFNQLAESKTRLPYDKRIRLGILFDLPTDKSLRPEQIARTQALYKTELPAEQAAQGAPPAAAPQQVARNNMTPAQKIEGGFQEF